VRRVPPSPAQSWPPAGAGGGRRALVELLAAAVAIALTIAIVVTELRGPPDSRAVGGDHPPGTAARTADGGAGADNTPSAQPPRTAGELLEDPGFEVGLGRWQAGQGTRLARVADGRSGSWAASLAAERSPAPSIGIRRVQRCQPAKQYAVTVWLRASRPVALVRVDLAEEVRGRRYAADTAGAVLEGHGWEPLEVVHVTHQPGAWLAIQITAVGLPNGGQVLVDDLGLQAATASSLP
jgi:hypothetical protein